MGTEGESREGFVISKRICTVSELELFRKVGDEQGVKVAVLAKAGEKYQVELGKEPFVTVKEGEVLVELKIKNDKDLSGFLAEVEKQKNPQ